MRRGGFSSGERSSGAAEEALGGGAHLLTRQGLAVFGFTLHVDLREVSCYAEAMPDATRAYFRDLAVRSRSVVKKCSFVSVVLDLFTKAPFMSVVVCTHLKRTLAGWAANATVGASINGADIARMHGWPANRPYRFC